LLTTPEFAEFMRGSGVADEIWAPKSTGWWDAGSRMSTARRLRRTAYERVYDLDGGPGARRYRRHLRRAECLTTPVGPGHIVDRQRHTLHDAGVGGVPLADLGWVDADISGFGLIGPYVLFVLAEPDHPGGNWPASKYAALARRLLRVGLTPVLLGSKADEDWLQVVRGTGVGIRNLIGRTTPRQVVELARGATGAIGNDTGVMHVVTLAGCPSLVLYGSDSLPAADSPRAGASGGRVVGIQKDDLRGLSVDEVEESLPFPLR
jgi:ADP-heptose:LPS heptosyltransferase